MIARQREIIKPEEEKKLALKITDLLIPIISLIVLLFMTIFVYIPTLQEADAVRAKIEEDKSKIEKINSISQTLKNIDVSQLNSDYELITKMIPYRLEVADFAFYVDELAKQKNLKLLQISASSDKVSAESLKTPAGDLYGVNGPLKYEGTYENIVSFFNEINTYSPYLINVSDISMSLQDSGTWSLEMRVTGFYIQQNEDISFNSLVYGTFTSYLNNPSLMEALRTRGEKLVQEDASATNTVESNTEDTTSDTTPAQ